MKKRMPHLISANNLFCNFDMKKLTGKGNIKRTYKCADKTTLAKQIFLRYLYIMFADFLEGGKTFLFPSKKYMEIRMRRIPADQFVKARKAGAYRNVDVIASGQICYEPVLCFRQCGRTMQDPIKLSNEFRDLIAWKVNTGYKYC
jgi:hypothetical protein